jgi:hypothetical protein
MFILASAQNPAFSWSITSPLLIIIEHPVIRVAVPVIAGGKHDAVCMRRSRELD